MLYRKIANYALRIGGLLLSFTLVCPPVIAQEAPAADHVVISEVQIAGATATDEFVELYNPTPQAIDLNGWRLAKRTASGTESNLLTSFPEDAVIPSLGFYLIAHHDYTGAVPADSPYSTSGSLAANNSVVLFADGGALVDLVGLGTATSFEGAAVANPPANQSISRSEGRDTNSNSTDFTTGSPTPMVSSGQESPEDPNEDPVPEDSGDGEATGGEPENSSITYAVGVIVINEFVADPVSGSDEWVELYSASSDAIDLTGWTLEDGAGSTTQLTGTIGGDQPFAVADAISGSLNNDSDAIILKDPSGQIIDAIAYGKWDDGDAADNAPTASDPRSVALAQDGLRDGSDSVRFAATTAVTKGQANRIEEPASRGSTNSATSTDEELSEFKTATPNVKTSVSKAAVPYLNELYPNPAGEDTADEYIELGYAGVETFDLKGWSITTSSGLRYAIPEGVRIRANELMALRRAQTGLAIPNTGSETIKLINPVGKTIDTVTVKDAEVEGIAYARDVLDKWQWTVTPTAGAANILTPPNTPPLVNVAWPQEARVGTLTFFDASDSADRDGDVVAFIWQFGADPADDQTTRARAFHIFTKPGAQTVSVTVSDGKLSTTARKKITVVGDAIGGDVAVAAKATKTSKAKAEASSAAQSQADAALPIAVTALDEAEAGAFVALDAVVAAAPGSILRRSFFLAGSGARVDIGSVDVPKLNVGDRIQLTGFVSDAGGSRHIRLNSKSTLAVIGPEAPPQPHEVSASEVDASMESWLIRLTGSVTKVNTASLVMSTDDQEVTVAWRGTLSPKPVVGDTLTATGIVRFTSSGWRLAARDVSDISIVNAPAQEVQPSASALMPTLESSPLPTFSGAAQTYPYFWVILSLLGATTVLGIILAIWWWRNRDAIAAEDEREMNDLQKKIPLA